MRSGCYCQWNAGAGCSRHYGGFFFPFGPDWDAVDLWFPEGARDDSQVAILQQVGGLMHALVLGDVDGS